MSLMLQWIALLKQSDGLQRHDQAVSRGARQYVERTVNLGKVRHTKRGELDLSTKATLTTAGQTIPYGHFGRTKPNSLIKSSKAAVRMHCCVARGNVPLPHWLGKWRWSFTPIIQTNTQRHNAISRAVS